MGYRKFDTGTWQDPWFEDLSPKAKLAFIYLWTNETCTPAGIYEISEKRIKFELGYGIDTIYSEIDTKTLWDDTRKIVWVKNFFRRQCQNYKFALAALNSIKDSPYMLSLFIEYNRELIESYVDKEGNQYIDLSAYHTDTIPIPYPTEQNRTETEQNRTEQNNYCSEPSPENSEPEPEKILSIPLIKKDGVFDVHQDFIDTLQDTYTGINVLSEIKKYKLWAENNPAKRKTAKGIKNSISYWLEKAQNSFKGGPNATEPTKPAVDKEKALAEYRTYSTEALKKLVGGTGNTYAFEILKERGEALPNQQKEKAHAQ